MSMQKHSVGGGLFGAIRTLLKPLEGPPPAALPEPVNPVLQPEGQVAPPASPAAARVEPGRYRRFLSDNPMLYEQAIAGAEAYVARMPPSGLGWLHAKPYDPAVGSPVYFRLMYDVLNILQAMQLPPNARILEVGSGPGWITEILLMLGHEVDALEPSADMIAVARERCAGLEPHFRFNGHGRVRFHKGTVEEIEFEPETFDSVLYFDVLHHVVDEHVALEKTFRFLRPQGCVGVVEAAWHPDFKELEAGLLKEIQEYGTLENPFSTGYLDELLSQSGFTGVSRYVGVNGFFDRQQIRRPLSDFGAPLHGLNNVVARKPGLPSCDNAKFRTGVRYSLVQGSVDASSGTADLTVTITNSGETLLDNRDTAKTPVTVALRRGAPGSGGFLESLQRHRLSTPLKPGESVTMALHFNLPEAAPVDGWELDAIAEGLYWFSTRGIGSLAVAAVAG